MARKIHKFIEGADMSVQKTHYDKIILEYEKHYGDKYSQAYREKFIYPHLFKNIHFKGKVVLEAMCGTGETTGYLISKRALVTGLDISDAAIDIFKRKWPGCEGKCASIFESNLPSDSFDIVVVVFGFHHVHPDLDKAILEIHRVLKKDGLLCFVEPHKDSLFDPLRRFWYKHDKLFAENERAVDLEVLKEKWTGRFKFGEEHYGGGLAYLLVYNSMIFRMLLSMKKYYAGLLFMLERLLRRLQGKFLSGFVICQWKKI